MHLHSLKLGGAGSRLSTGRSNSCRSCPWRLTFTLAEVPDGRSPLWVTEERAPMSYLAVSTDLKRIIDRSGLSIRDRSHIFRRTLAARSQREGVPRQYALAVMGWTTTAMLDRYTRWMQEEEIEAFRELEPFGA